MTYFGNLQYHTKRAERIVQQLFVYFGVEIADEYVGANVEILLMCGCL
jgi:hypothetical protein